MISIPITHAWPTTLPLPLIDHQGDARNTTLVSQIEHGPITRRSRSRRAYATINVIWALNLVQFDLFQDFVNSTLGCSVSMFSLDLRYPETSALLTYVVRFKTEYGMQYDAGLYQVTAQLDIFGRAQVANLITDSDFEQFLTAFDSATGVEEELVTSDGLFFTVHKS